MNLKGNDKTPIKRHREPTSWVWDHFTNTDEKNAKCNHCHKSVSKAATTNLANHLKKSHPSKIGQNEDVKVNKPTRYVQNTINNQGVNSHISLQDMNIVLLYSQ